MRRLLLSASVLLSFACGTDVIDHSQTERCQRGVIEKTIPGSATLQIRTVSEYGYAPMGGIAVQIDDQPWTTTDAEGYLSLPAPSGPYTFRAHQIAATERFRFDDVWELKNLTGNALTLCADGSTAPSQEGKVSGLVRGAAGGQVVKVFVPHHGIGPDGAFGQLADGTGAFEAEVLWEGSTRDINVQALSSDTSMPPNEYFGYGAIAAVLGPGDLSDVDFELESITTARVLGTTSLPAGFTQLRPSLELYAGGSRLWLGDAMLDAASPSFDYAFPVIEGTEAGISMFAYEADGRATGHDKRVALPSNGVVFDPPPPIVQLEPTTGATVALAATTFTWNAGPPGGETGLHFVCELWMQDGLRRNVSYRYVAPTGNQGTLPAIPDLTIPPGTVCSWSVSWSDGERFSRSTSRPLFVQ